MENFSAQILRLDQALAQYGPETKPMRDGIKEGIEKAYATIWGGGTVDPALLTVGPPLASAQATADYLATLQPKTDAQKAALATANTYASLVEQSRLLMSLQIAAGPVSRSSFFGPPRCFSLLACTPSRTQSFLPRSPSGRCRSLLQSFSSSNSAYPIPACSR
jgi:hypothetical protein